jgi:hypothetical protein
MSPWDDVDHTHLDVSNIDVNDQQVMQRAACLNLRHCSETDTMTTKCDFVVIKLRGKQVRPRVMLLVISALLAVPLTIQMERAMLDEALLDFSL